MIAKLPPSSCSIGYRSFGSQPYLRTSAWMWEHIALKVEICRSLVEIKRGNTGKQMLTAEYLRIQNWCANAGTMQELSKEVCLLRQLLVWNPCSMHVHLLLSNYVICDMHKHYTYLLYYMCQMLTSCSSVLDKDEVKSCCLAQEGWRVGSSLSHRLSAWPLWGKRHCAAWQLRETEIIDVVVLETTLHFDLRGLDHSLKVRRGYQSLASLVWDW